MKLLDLTYFASILLATLHLLMYFKLKTRKLSAFAGCFVMFLATWPLVRVVQACNSLVASAALTLAMAFYGSWILGLFLIKVKFSRLIFAAYSVMACILVAMFMPMAVLHYCWGMPFNEEMLYYARLAYMGLYVILLPLFFFTREHMARILDAAENQNWFVVVLLPLSFCFFANLAMHMLLEDINARDFIILSFMLPVIVVVIFVSLYNFVTSRNEYLLLQQRIDASESLEKIYRFYDRELAEKERHFQTVRHDFRHLINHLDMLAKDGDLEGISSHLKAVAGLTDDLAVTRFCDNRTVNAVVSYHFAAAAKNGTNCVAKIFLPDPLDILDAELALVIGNALENSVKATEPLGKGGFITFTARPIKNYMAFKFTNNYEPGNYRSGQNLGLTSIRKLCDEYEGWIEELDNDGIFQLTVILLLNRNNSD